MERMRLRWRYDHQLCIHRVGSIPYINRTLTVHHEQATPHGDSERHYPSKLVRITSHTSAVQVSITTGLRHASRTCLGGNACLGHSSRPVQSNFPPVQDTRSYLGAVSRRQVSAPSSPVGKRRRCLTPARELMHARGSSRVAGNLAETCLGPGRSVLNLHKGLALLEQCRRHAAGCLRHAMLRWTAGQEGCSMSLHAAIEFCFTLY
jgi:hypothetical protein